VPLFSLSALIQKGQIAEAIALGKAALIAWEGAGIGIEVPFFKSVLAEGIAQLDDLDTALDLIDKSIAQVERPGWEERCCHAETLRIKGCLLARKGDPGKAERAFIASLDCARTQQAKSWELRTATSYARLMRDQRRVGEAHELLAPIYGWFTEGFATKDLQEAKALLEELETSGAPATAASA
jgi:predicted ATPase